MTPRAAGRWTRVQLRRAAASILAEGLRAADPGALVRRWLRAHRSALPAPRTRGRLLLVAAGKAAPAMAKAAEEVLGARITAGLAVTNAPGPPLSRVTVRLAGHPVPDARGLSAAEQVETLVRGLSADDLVLVLLSGGASALLPSPAFGLTLDEKAATTSLLLRAGADIAQLNTVRKHMSRLKGGGLARTAAPARVLALVLSDVVGDDLATIASGPTAPDPTTYADALAVLAERSVLDQVPPGVRAHLEAGARGERPETPKPGDGLFRRVETHVIGSNGRSVAAAAREAQRLGLRPLVLTTRLEGEAREAGRFLVSILRECVESVRPARPPVCLVAGGETTVRVEGHGQGGRNQELATAAAAALDGFPVPAVVASLATDGIDGASDAAGGVVDDETCRRGREVGLAPPSAFLAANDTRNFLGPLADLIVTGPTGTNVVDLVVALAGAGRNGRAA